MRFSLQQSLPGTVEQVVAAFTDPGYLATLGDLSKVGAPEVLGHERDGEAVHQRVRYRFTGRLAPAVTAVVDREKLVWVDEHTYDLQAATASFRIVPEHYADRLRCGGTERFDADGDRTTRSVEGEVKVRWPVVGGVLERAIVSGLREHLDEEVELVTRWLTRG